jgi:hypothetical protein
MHGQAWIALIRRIPARLHDALALTLVTGSEIVIQDILRLDPDYVILRGRMAGSTDAGRVVVMPYDQIVNLVFTKRMTEPEVQSIFGQASPSDGEPAGSSSGPAAVASGMAQAADPAQAVPDETIAAANSDTPVDAAEIEVEEAPATGMTVALRTAPPPPKPAATEKPKPAVSKSVLLARLRQRLAEQKLPNSGS